MTDEQYLELKEEIFNIRKRLLLTDCGSCSPVKEEVYKNAIDRLSVLAGKYITETYEQEKISEFLRQQSSMETEEPTNESIVLTAEE